MTRRALRTVIAVACAATAVVASTAAAAPATDGEPPAISAKAAILVQPDTGAVLYSRDADERRPIASTTKLMTALLALERLKLDDVVPAVPYTATRGESVVYLRVGERMTVADLLRALLLPSANDAAATLAVAVAGSRRAFVDLMNRRARELGLSDTRYANPIGLDDRRNYSSAADLVALTLELRRYPFFVTTTDLPSLVLHSGSHKRVVTNRNTLLRAEPEVDGVKTGHTGRAGNVLVASATRDGVAMISVVLGEPDERTRDADSLALLRYGLARFRRATLVTARRPVTTVAIKDQGDDRVALVPTRTISLVVARSGGPSVTTVVRGPDEVEGPLPAGARVGTVEVREAGRVVARADLVTAAPVPRASLMERLRAWVGRPVPLAGLALLVICSLTLAIGRRRWRRPSRGAQAS